MTSPDSITALLERAEDCLQQGREGEFEAIKGELESREDEAAFGDLILIEHAFRYSKAKAAVDENPHDPGAWHRWIDTLRRAHRAPEATAALHRAIDACPSEAIFSTQLVERYLGARCYVQALAELNRVLETSQRNARLLRMRAEIAVRIHADDAHEAVAEAWDAEPQAWPTLHNLMLRSGGLAEVERRLKDLLGHSDQPLFVQGALGRLALWRGRTAEAQAAGDALLAEYPDAVEGLFLVGASRALGDMPDAKAPLEQCLARLQPRSGWVERSAVHGWLSEVAVQESDLERALHHADLAMSSAEFYSANALLQRHRVILMLEAQKRKPAKRSGEKKRRSVWARVVRWMTPLVENVVSSSVNPRWRPAVANYGHFCDSGPANWDSSNENFAEMLDHIHAHIGGNRSSIPTWNSDTDGLLIIPSSISTHIDTRSVQQHLRALPVEAVIEEFNALAQAHPDNPEVHTYGGEVRVWAGHYAASEDSFRTALQGSFTTIWSWIGLGAAQGLQGRLREGLATFQEGYEATDFEGPSVFVYRGEFHRRLGDVEAARRDLDLAIQHKPQRVSAWINRVLLDADMGDESPMALMATAMKRSNPGLWSDAADVAGSDPRDAQAHRAILEACLTLMRGNRSSQIFTYLLPDGTLRFAAWRAEDAPTALALRYGMPTGA